MVEPQISFVQSALDSPDAEERRQATARLGPLGVEAALPLLVRALGDADWRVRKEATIAARQLAGAPSLVAAMIDVLARAEDVGLRNAAVEVLAAVGAGATEALAEALAGLDADGRKLAVEAMGRGRDPAALDALAGTLDRDADPNVRQAAMDAVGQLGVTARERASEILRDALADRDPLVRLSALAGLCALLAPIPWERLAPCLAEPILRPLALAACALADSPEAVAVLVRTIEEARGETFVQAIASLAHLAQGPLRDEAARALRERRATLGARLCALAADRSLPAERRATALTLAAAARAPGTAEVAFAALADELLTDVARRALLALGGAELPALLTTLADPTGDAGSRAELVRVIAELADDAPEVRADPALLPALRAATRDAELRIATSALAALSALGTGDDLAPVAALTLAGDRALAHAAADALAELCRAHPAAARVHAAAFSADGARFLPAVIALGALASAGMPEPGTAVFLAQVAATGNTPARRAAVLAAAEIEGPLTLEVLRIALTDEEHEVQLAAARALGHRVASSPELHPGELLDPVERSGELDLWAAAVRAIGERVSLAHGDRRSTPPPTAAIVAVLAGYARSAPSPVALAAVDSLGQVLWFGAAATVALAAALEHPDASVARAATFKLGEAPPGLAVLLRALEHPSPHVRARVVEALLETALPDARERLVRHAATEPDAEVRGAIERAIAAASRSSDAGPLSRRNGSSRPPGEGIL